jgi:hypothetical protein
MEEVPSSDAEFLALKLSAGQNLDPSAFRQYKF